jgi:hypothetical protein
MASQLGTSVTPGGVQAHSDLINTEMQNRAMGLNAMQNNQNQALAARQLDQQGMMHADRMNQADNQFSAQLGEMQRQREHEISREDIGYGRANDVMTKQQGFQAAQAEALRKWQVEQTQKAQKFELEIENLTALREKARDEGQLEAFEKLTTSLTALKVQRSKKAMATALSSRMLGKTTRENEAILDLLKDELTRKVSIEQQNQALAGKFVPSLTNRIDKMGQESSMQKFKEFHAEQLKGPSFSLLPDTLNPYSTNFGDVGSAVSTGALEGLEWLKLAPANFGRLAGLGGSTTTQGSAFNGYVDPGTMAETIKGRLVEGTLMQLGEMGFKNLNQDAARNLVMTALSGGSKAEVAKLAAAAGVPTSTLKYLFDGAARAHEASSSNPRYQKLMEMDARFRELAGYQENDLKVMAVTKAKEAYGTTQKYYRTAANAFDDMSLEDYNAGIDVLGNLKKTGQYNDLAGSTLEKIGLSSEAERLKKLMGRIPQAKEDLEASAMGLGDIEEQTSSLESMAPVLMARGATAGTTAYQKRLAELLAGYEDSE